MASRTFYIAKNKGSRNATKSDEAIDIAVPKSRSRGGRPKAPMEIQRLILEMSLSNRLAHRASMVSC